MGDTYGDGYPNEKPVHEVCVDGFYMGKYEVTVKEFRKFVDETGYRTEAEKGDGCFVYTGRDWKKGSNNNWRNPGISQSDNYPVVCVSHNDSVEYIRWLREKAKKRYRLPTEAEWEYAARSGGKSEKWAGTSDEHDLILYAWYSRNSNSNTHPVGEKRPNGQGLYDMSGNVWEWCQDWYGEKYYESSPKNNPQGPGGGQYRARRGGSWFNDPRYVRASVRSWGVPTDRTYNSGFRLVLPSE